MSGATSGDADLDTLWPTEWWERTRRRRESWAERNTAARRVLATGRTVLLFAAVVWVVVAAVIVPELRSGIGAWLGVIWIGLVTFVVMRTKTLSWSAFWGIFTVALVWSVAFGLALRALAQAVGSAGVEAAGPAVAIASVGEESLKLVPVVAIALLAPARVHRFALADWLLVGLACGTAFMAVEETLRRILFAADSPAADGLPFTFTSFGFLGADPGYSGAAYFPGHHVATSLVVVSVGLGVLLLRRGSRETGPLRPVLLTLAVLVPVATWWSAVVRHAALNAEVVDTVLPWPMGAWNAVLPDAWGSSTWVVAAVVLVLLVDARRLSRWADASFEAGAEPAWVAEREASIDVARDRLDAKPRWVRVLGSAAASVAAAAVRLSHIVVRDVRQVLEAHSSRMGTKRWAAGRAARTLVIMQREMRQIAYHLDGGPTRRARTRVLALAALVVLLLAALVVAPLLARSLEAGTSAPGASTWLAGLLADFGSWWGGLTPWEQLTAGAGLLSMAALSAASLGSDVIDAASDAPMGTYATLTPASALLEVGQAGLTLGMSGVASGSAAGLHDLAADYRADPSAWRGARAEQLARSAPGR